jgi:hypothetical protein
LAPLNVYLAQRNEFYEFGNAGRHDIRRDEHERPNWRDMLGQQIGRSRNPADSL